jgi:nucleoside-diphosphate-sugar epimerase
VVALSHVADVTAIIAAAIGNAKAYKQAFNCGTDKFISYKGLCEAIAKAANSKCTSAAVLLDARVACRSDFLT